MNINNMTQSHRCMVIGSQRHTLDVHKARSHQQRRAANREYRRQRRRKIAQIIVDISLGAATAIGILAAVGLLATVAS